MTHQHDPLIVVYTTANDAYVPYAAVALESIRRFHSELDYYIVCSADLLSDASCETAARAGVQLLDFDDGGVFGGTGQWSRECYWALAGPELLASRGYQYSLYVEGDILCRVPIDVAGVAANVLGFAGIENQEPLGGNFTDSAGVLSEFELPEEILAGHNTNTGLLFWNNMEIQRLGLWDASVETYMRARGMLVHGDQALFALMSVLLSDMHWLVLDHSYNYRLGNQFDRQLPLGLDDIRVLHFTGEKPWAAGPGARTEADDPLFWQAKVLWWELARTLQSVASPSDSEVVAPVDTVERIQSARAQFMDAYCTAVPHVTFVQIGSNDGVYSDPIRESVLAHGWTGIMVEPLGPAFEQLLVNYAGVSGLRFENVAVAEFDGSKTFYYVPETPGLPHWHTRIGSFCRETVLWHSADIPDLEQLIAEVEVPCVTFETLVTRGDLEKLDVLQIDAEGYDFELLKTIDLGRYCPSLVMYESKHLSDDDRDACARMLDSREFDTVEVLQDTIAVGRALIDAHPDMAASWRSLRAAAGAEGEAQAPVPTEEAPYYEVSPTCQIVDLPRLLETVFGRLDNGVFVEIGAFDGEYVSNTSGLADMGWRGFYVEPVPEYFERCKNRHSGSPGVTVSRCAIGAQSGEAELFVGEVLSTTRSDVKRIFEGLDWARGVVTDQKVRAPMMTLEQYLLEHDVPKGFELLSVDVEGCEWDVFRVFDIDEWAPKMVIVELHDVNDDYLEIRSDCAHLEAYFHEHGYRVVWKNLSNTVYVRRELDL